MRKILIVEENKMFQKIYQNLLVGRGFEVIPASSIEECDQQLQEITPDLVLVNPIISSGRGVELMERIRGPRGGFSGIPMLVISSKDELEMKQAALRLGAVEYVVKHMVQPKAVVKKIEDHLKHRPPAPKHALDPRSLKPGDILDDRYKILERLGRGGQGAVFRTYDQRLNEEIALKILILNPEIAEDAMESFLSEVRLSRKVAHPNVIRVHDIGQSGGIHYITMELVKGKDLNQYSYDHWPLSYADLIQIFIQIASALRAAHETGIIHRDVKPQNILLTCEGIVKMGDFGIASVAGALLKTTEELSFGTPDYMAPELAIIEPEMIDQRIDIYSFGVVMYEAFTGVLPYEGKTIFEVIQLHQEGKPNPPRAMNPDFPEDLEYAILKCMKRDPEDRFYDMDEVIAALKRVPIPSA